MLQDDRTSTKNLSDGVPVPVEGDREVLLVRRRGRWRAMLAAFWLPMALTACGDLGGGVENICTPCWKRGLMCKYEVKATLSGAPYYQVSCLKVDTTFEVPMSEAPEIPPQ